MLYSIIYVILAAIGLGFLIFIHELGHYFMARRMGMTVEVFAIGFGKPIYTWKHKGAEWRLCCLPFGGYVRIAGMEKSDHLEPHEIPNGFYSKTPWQRIKVAFMGPFVNMLFAFLVFILIWISGGREKTFSEFTHLIGWIDPQSELYELGVRPGDQITEYADHPFNGFNDLAYSSLVDKKTVKIKGYRVEYINGRKEPFTYTLKSYQDPRFIDPDVATIGVFTPASYLIYDKKSDGSENPLVEGSPMEQSGIQYNDRIIWGDGQLIFSQQQLSSTINEQKALLTIERKGERLLARIPRLKIAHLSLSPNEKAELDDLKHEAHIKLKTEQIYFIPYNLSHACVVEGTLSYIDENLQEGRYQKALRSFVDFPLEKGDRILAVDGKKIFSAADLLANLQEKKILLIVQRNIKQNSEVSWKIEDRVFEKSIHWGNLNRVIKSIGTDISASDTGDFYLLNPITPKPLFQFALSETKKTWYLNELNEKKKAIEEIDNPERKKLEMQVLEDNQNKLMLGIILQDAKVRYNPSPIALFTGVVDQMWRTISALLLGNLSPKWMAGPVGIVQVFQYGWSVGIKEALFWMGVISLNLGIVNLLPIPVLDGGHICFSVIETIRGKPIKSKTMERVVIPFIVLMVAIFIYFTYNDLVRVFKSFF